MYSTAKLSNAYKREAVYTSSPGDLVVMLYDGCLKQLKMGCMYIEDKNIEGAHKCLCKAQEFIGELVKSLDLSYDISENLLMLYEFMMSEIRDANLEKSVERVNPVIEMLTELRGAWDTARRTVGQRTYVAE